MANNDTRRLRVVVTGDSGGAQQALEEVGSSSEKTESKLGALAKTIAGFGAKGVLALGAVGAAAATMGISTASQMEQAEVGFTTMLGSAKAAQKFLKQLQQFANTTPFEFTELTGAAQRLMAMGFQAKQVIPTLTAIGDAVAAMGGSQENIDAVTTALGQMQAKGKVSGEELMQLTDQGIPALKILADSYKVSTAQMSKMITAGKVQSSKAIPLLIKGLEDGTKSVKGFGGMMNAQSETMKGKWSTFMDTMKSGLGNIAKNFLPLAKKGIQGLSDAMGAFFKGLQGTNGNMKGFMATLNGIGLGLRAMIGAWQEGDVTSDGLVGKFEKFAVVAHQVVNSLIDIGKQTMGVIGWFREHDKVTAALAISMGALLAVTKTYAAVQAVQAAGGLLAMFKNLTLIASVIRTATAVQWAYNGAMAAASYLQIAGYLGAVAVGQKLVAAGTKIAAAAQWLWNAAMSANPIGIVITVIAALVAAVVLLWKNNEGFRNFVLNVLWPSIQKAWEQLKGATMAVVNALITAWNATKNAIIAAWNAVWGFLAPIVQKIIAVMTPIVDVIAHIATVILGFYNAVWKVVWILIQIAVKVFVAYLQNIVWPAIQTAINAIAAIIKWLYNNVWKPEWDLIKAIMSAVIGWVTNTLVPSFQKAWGQLKTALTATKNFFVNIWNAISDAVRNAYNKIAGPIGAVLSKAINTFKGWLNGFKSTWNSIFDALKSKVDKVMSGVTTAFNKGKDGIKAAWDKVVSVTKKPVNFVINDVYNQRILPLWNKVAEKFGIKTRLDSIKGFARGGVVGHGKGFKDEVPAMLTRGEGVLTTKEMDRLGGRQGFNAMRQSLAMYNKGGMVGDGPGSWFKSLVNKGKDIFQGVAGKVIAPLVNSARSFINSHLDSNGVSGLMRGGATTILNKLASWVSGKDKEISALGGSGGAGMGWARQRALISAQFPGLHMISGFRPGARTLSGNQSYHALGRAVDYPPNRALALWIRSHFGSVTKELITPWNELNLHNGKPHRYTGAVWNQHNFPGGNAHDHWAMDGVSRVQPGWFSGYNGTGKPETLVNKDLLGSGITINGGLHLHGVQDVKGLRDELQKLAKRNGGSAGLPGK